MPRKNVKSQDISGMELAERFQSLTVSAPAELIYWANVSREIFYYIICSPKTHMALT